MINRNELDTENGRTKPLYMMRCAIRLKTDSVVPGARIVGEGKPEQSHIFPEGEFDEKAADRVIEFVMQQIRDGKRKFRIETSNECAPATAVTFALSLLFDTKANFECGPLGNLVHNYLRCANDRWRGRTWRAKREALARQAQE